MHGKMRRLIFQSKCKRGDAVTCNSFERWKLAFTQTAFGRNGSSGKRGLSGSVRAGASEWTGSGSREAPGQCIWNTIRNWKSFVFLLSVNRSFRTNCKKIWQNNPPYSVTPARRLAKNETYASHRLAFALTQKAEIRACAVLHPEFQANPLEVFSFYHFLLCLNTCFCLCLQIFSFRLAFALTNLRLFWKVTVKCAGVRNGTGAFCASVLCFSKQCLYNSTSIKSSESV